MTSLYELAKPTYFGYRVVSAAEVANVHGAKIVDVREPHEFHGELGHIPNAELVPLATLAAKAQTWDQNAEILLVCRVGGRSAQAAKTLTELGFTRIINMAGGMVAYNSSGLPVQRS